MWSGTSQLAALTRNMSFQSEAHDVRDRAFVGVGCIIMIIVFANFRTGAAHAGLGNKGRKAKKERVIKGISKTQKEKKMWADSQRAKEAGRERS